MIHFSAYLLRSAFVAPSVNKFVEHAERAAVVGLAQSPELGQLGVRHTHVLLVGLSDLTVGQRL